jgi:hypothetical protein
MHNKRPYECEIIEIAKALVVRRGIVWRSYGCVMCLLLMEDACEENSGEIESCSRWWQ